MSSKDVPTNPTLVDRAQQQACHLSEPGIAVAAGGTLMDYVMGLEALAETTSPAPESVTNTTRPANALSDQEFLARRARQRAHYLATQQAQR